MADDDEDFYLFFKEAFEKTAVPGDLEYVENGEELMNSLLGQGRFSGGEPKKLPALILLDLNMPKMSGREALKEIRAHADLKHIPVLILTISDSRHDILDSYRIGANSFITKPFLPSEMEEFIRKIKEYWLECVKIPGFF